MLEGIARACRCFDILQINCTICVSINVRWLRCNIAAIHIKLNRLAICFPDGVKCHSSIFFVCQITYWSSLSIHHCSSILRWPALEAVASASELVSTQIFGCIVFEVLFRHCASTFVFIKGYCITVGLPLGYERHALRWHFHWVADICFTCIIWFIPVFEGISRTRWCFDVLQIDCIICISIDICWFRCNIAAIHIKLDYLSICWPKCV